MKTKLTLASPTTPTAARPLGSRNRSASAARNQPRTAGRGAASRRRSGKPTPRVHANDQKAPPPTPQGESATLPFLAICLPDEQIKDMAPGSQAAINLCTAAWFPRMKRVVREALQLTEQLNPTIALVAYLVVALSSSSTAGMQGPIASGSCETRSATAPVMPWTWPYLCAPPSRIQQLTICRAALMTFGIL